MAVDHVAAYLLLQQGVTSLDGAQRRKALAHGQRAHKEYQYAVRIGTVVLLEVMAGHRGPGKHREAG